MDLLEALPDLGVDRAGSTIELKRLANEPWIPLRTLERRARGRTERKPGCR